MQTSLPTARTVASFILALSIAPLIALAQTSEGLPEATAGTSAGSLAVMLEFIVDHDTAYFAEDAEYQVMAQPEPFRGREAISEFFGMMYGGAFTDTHVELRTVLADGSRVVLEFVFNGTNTGELMGMAPTGQRVSVPILGIFEIEGDAIRSGRIYYDTATMTQQLNATTSALLDRSVAACPSGNVGWEGPTLC